MNELINVQMNENQEPIVSGRDLHEFLGVKEKYTQWFERMAEYGFLEGVDFQTSKVNIDIDKTVETIVKHLNKNKGVSI